MGRGTPLVACPLTSNPYGDHESRETLLIPILEAGARTGKSTTDPRTGIGIGEPGDPMYTLQGGKQHAVAFNWQAGGNQGTLDANCNRTSTLQANQTPAVAFNLRGREDGAQPEIDPDGLASVRAASGGSSRSYVAGVAVRRLTPRECERLQAFPDGWTDIAYRKILKSGKISKRLYRAADGPRYKAIGNSMTVNVLRWILDRIESVQSMKQKTQEAGAIKTAAFGPAAVTVTLESTGACEPTSERSTEALSENASEAK